MTAHRSSNCVINFLALGWLWVIQMERTTHHGDAATAPNNGSRQTISPDNGSEPPESVEVRIGRLESTVARLMTANNSSENHSEFALRSGLGETGSFGHLLTEFTGQLKRIADHFDPPPPDLVGSTYIADRLGCTTVWVAEMARRGIIPTSCVVQGTGNGKPWKFLRVRIDEWLKRR